MWFRIMHRSLMLHDLKPGKYQRIMRAVDNDGFPQLEPMPSQRSGRNMTQMMSISLG